MVWRRIVFTIVIISLLKLPVLGLATSPTGNGDLIISTTSGLVQGYLDANTTSVPLNKWLGVRFADDTSGQNRWRPPKSVFVPGVFDATTFGPACMQGRVDGGNGTSVQSEDCLRINIIAPKGAKDLPVYIYSYGGGFDSGSSSDPKIDGSFLAAKGIIFASYNYRLSLFGYPHAAEIAEAGQTQNFGLLDTRAAVEWLRDNVRQFGGDPEKITLGGESVGAEMTNQYLTAFYQDPLIRGAVMQSSDTSQPMWPLNDQISKIATNFSCPTGHGLLDCLRSKSGIELQQVLLDTGTQFQPVTDNVTIFKDFVKLTKAGRTARVPLLVGTNKDEGTLIVEGEPTAYLDDITAYSKSNNLNFPFANLSILEDLYPVPSNAYPTAYNATAAIWRDAHMLCLASNLATQRTNALGLPVWRYRFDLVANNLNSLGAVIGTFHGEDIRFVMGTWRTIALSPPFIPATPDEIKVSDLMVEAWTNFIKDPQEGPQILGWKKYDPRDTTSIAILGNSLTEAEPGDHLSIDSTCAYWNTILPVFPETFPTCGNWTCS
ncbi:carboxylesterase [Abortiporus biennis]|nr:carboxylesterase [Abortiporus biennis]